MVGCVIPDKNTLNKNKLSQVGGNSWLLCSVWAAMGKSLQLEPFPMLLVFPDRSCWGACSRSWEEALQLAPSRDFLWQEETKCLAQLTRDPKRK